jgi:hypothetical protein
MRFGGRAPAASAGAALFQICDRRRGIAGAILRL